MTLVDTDVMVDIRRGHPPALAWFDGLEEVPGLPGFVLMELVAGCKTRKDMREVRFINDARLLHPVRLRTRHSGFGGGWQTTGRGFSPLAAGAGGSCRGR